MLHLSTDGPRSWVIVWWCLKDVLWRNVMYTSLTSNSIHSRLARSNLTPTFFICKWDGWDSLVELARILRRHSCTSVSFLCFLVVFLWWVFWEFWGRVVWRKMNNLCNNVCSLHLFLPQYFCGQYRYETTARLKLFDIECGAKIGAGRRQLKQVCTKSFLSYIYALT